MPGLKIKIIMIVSCYLVSATAAAQAAEAAMDCREIYPAIVADVRQIKSELLQIDSRHAYRDSVSRRYAMLEPALKSLGSCAPDPADKKIQQTLQQLRTSLAGLQASARASAFSKFEDWLKAKEQDVSLCQRALADLP